MMIGRSLANETPAADEPGVDSAARVLALRRGAEPGDFTEDELEFARRVYSCVVSIIAARGKPPWLDYTLTITRAEADRLIGRVVADIESRIVVVAVLAIIPAGLACML